MKRKLDEDQSEVQIPIPAMLDVVFQLLAFFIMNFHPTSVAEGQMDMFLPATSQAKGEMQKMSIHSRYRQRKWSHPPM